MSRQKHRAILFAIIYTLTMSLIAAEELTGREIMEKVDKRYTGDDQVADMTIILIKTNSQKRIRKVRLWKKEYGENDKWLMQFLEPEDVRGTGFLVWEHKGKDNDQWLYLPALKKVLRISSEEKGQSFMGTDFSHEDLRSYNLDDYNYTFLKYEEIDGQDCCVVKSVPKPGKQKSYSKTINWIRRDIFIVVKVDFYDKEEKFLKQLHATNIETIDGIWTAKRIEMENVQKKHRTIIEFENIRYNIRLDANIFTERNLIKE